MRFFAGLARFAAIALVMFGLVVVPVQSVQAAQASDPESGDAGPMISPNGLI